MPDHAPQIFVERVCRALKLLYLALSHESAGIDSRGAARDTDFLRAVRKCVLLFYQDGTWEKLPVSQPAAERAIAGAVRTLVESYAATGTSRDQYTPDAQKVVV